MLGLLPDEDTTNIQGPAMKSDILAALKADESERGAENTVSSANTASKKHLKSSVFDSDNTSALLPVASSGAEAGSKRGRGTEQPTKPKAGASASNGRAAASSQSKKTKMSGEADNAASGENLKMKSLGAAAKQKGVDFSTLPDF
jgi:hypothetical protein